MTDILKIMFAEKTVRHLVSRVIPSLSVGSFRREWFNYLVPRVSILETRGVRQFITDSPADTPRWLRR